MAVLFGVEANAQWTLTSILPPGAVGGSISAGVNGKLAGTVAPTGGFAHAAFWPASNGSFVDLHPSGFSATDTSYALATNGTQQAGTIYTDGSLSSHAALWSGTAASFVDLSVPGLGITRVNAMTATQQGGVGMSDLSGSGRQHALIWSGTAQSVVDIHPAGFYGSEVRAMAGAKQGGYAYRTDGRPVAMLWSGSSTAYVELDAGIYLGYSEILAMTDTLQGGVVSAGTTLTEQAVIWSGTARSVIYLGGTNSRILAMAGDFQAGEANNQAAVWRGSSSSYENLHSLVISTLGSSFTTSTIRGAYIQNGFIYLVGWASDSIRKISLPVIWSELIVAAPKITDQPTSRYVNAGWSAMFSSSATGQGPISFQWCRNDVAIAGATSNKLWITNCSIADEGIYTMVATNAAGSAISNGAILNVIAAPVISQQPANQIVTVGTTATFTVVAGGTPTLTYQWQKNGMSIAGATDSSFAITSANASDAGNYSTVVTNSVGSVTSSAASLIVVVPPGNAIVTITIE